MAERGVTDAGVARLDDVPTGTVTAELTPRGDARYTIVENVAWDRIPVSEAVAAPAAASRALVYGSLALRSAANRDALGRLLEAVPTYAWRVFDVNLRAPFDDLTLVREYARHANLLKLNAEEAARLAGEPGRDVGVEEEHARRLAAETGVGWVCITSGDRGAGVLRSGRWTWEPGRRVDVVDTVGAGDAFLAQLLAGLLAGGRSEAQLVADACRRGEWVASRAGACPDGPGPERES
jgi:fructokinase